MSMIQKEEVCKANIKEYSKLAGHYDEEHNSASLKNALEKNIKEILNHTKKDNLKIIDIACGTGLSTRYLFKHTKKSEIFCLDISKNMLNILKRKLSPEDLKRAKFICSDALSYFNESKNNFDIIVVHGALHHIYDYLDVIKASSKKLNKGGMYYIAGEPLPKKKYNYYIDQTFRIWDRVFWEQKNNKFKQLLFLAYAPLNFLAPVLNSKFVKSIKNLVLHGRKDMKRDDLIEYWGYDKGLDLDKIIKILNGNNLEIIKSDSSHSFKINFFYRIEELFKIKPFFDLVAIKTK